MRSFVGALLARRRMEREMDAELQFHLDARVADFVAAGMSRADAVHRARAEFGDPLRWKEAGREARGLRRLDEIRADALYAVRWLRRSPAFTCTAVLSLTLGIGANAAIFSVLNAVLLRSLPVRHPEQLVVFTTVQAGRDPNYSFSFNTFQRFQRDGRSLEGVAATKRQTLTIELDGRTLPAATCQMVSGNYYLVLGVRPARGRVIVPEDDAPTGASAVAVLGYRYWQGQFGGDSAIIGTVVRLNDQPFTIIGVSAPEFFGTHVGETADVTVPLAMQPLVNATFGPLFISGPGADDYAFELIGRVRTDVPVTTAHAEMDGLFQQLLPDMLKRLGPKAKRFGHPHLRLEPGSKGLSELRRRFSQPLIILMGVVGLVLLICCANVANLLLARAASRRRELAVRVSLGAGRARLVRQLVTESLLLALAGGILGLLLAIWSSRALATLLVDSRTQAFGGDVDLAVLLFTLAISVVTGLLFGIVPALGACQVEAFTALREGSQQTTASGRRFGVRGVLVMVQVAISVVLLVSAALFARTLLNLRQLDLGFEQEHVLTLRVEPRGSNQRWEHLAQLQQVYGQLVTRLHATPGVRAVSLSGSTPLSHEDPLRGEMVIPGYVPQTDEDMHYRVMAIYPGYFATLGIPLLAGRDLAPRDDDPRAPTVAVINDAMARRFFATPTAAVGRHFIDTIAMEQLRPLSFEIVGVVGNTRDRVLREEVMPLAYATLAHVPTSRGQMTLLIRTTGDPQALVGTVRRIAREIDPVMPLLDVQTLADRVAAATGQERLVALLSSLFAGLALVLAAVGVYGVMAYTVTRRRAEFGVRLALGASRGRLTRLVLGESLALVGIGLTVGIVAAGGTAGTVSHLLFGLQPLDPIAFLAAAMILVIVATLAAYVPARQAALVDPVVTLRNN
jgi:predicted permease